MASRQSRIITASVILGFLWFALGTSAAQQPGHISGTVEDSSGAAVAGAHVTVHSAHNTQTVDTDSAGKFDVSGMGDLTGTLDVTAGGFATASQAWLLDSGGTNISVVLQPGGQSERIVVSASRTEMKLSDVPGSAVQLLPTDIQANPALTLDDLLRQVPGFTLFRRSSSRVANPTTQGVSLRGVGASGPSRALVLEDGVPLVDPFGGWVYWDRIPREGLSSVEVFRGGSSSLYGSDALGGVVQFLSRVPEAPSMSADISYGTENTPDLSFWTGTAISRWDISTSADLSHTDGYILPPGSQRGPVDALANSEHATISSMVGYRLSEQQKVFLSGGYFTEYRHNGTVLQHNGTATGFGALGWNAQLGSNDEISARLFGQAQGYDQTFSSIRSISTSRDTEVLTDFQHVPSQQLGGSVQWNHTIRSHTIVAGVDTQEVMGASDELLTLTSAFSVSGGRQRTAGIFGQDIFRVARWTVIAGLRWDDWNNFRGNTFVTPQPAGPPSITGFPDRSDNAFSPRLSLLRTLTSNLSFSVSGYRAFRAPTLNELYRSFQQGTVFTEDNPLLRAERLSGAEAGLRATALNNKLESRATVFWADIVDPVTNVTLSSGSTIIRQRQNLGRNRSVGLELDGILRLNHAIQLSGGYQYTHATVADTPTLAGQNVPEVPRHQFSWEARYWDPRTILLNMQGRFASSQFDDDLNTLVLPRYYVMDLQVGRQLRRGLVFYVAAENLTNQRYLTQLTPPTPLRTLGPPITARAGLRIDLPRAK